MANVNKTVLKTYFETGDKPTSQNFADLIDSNLNIAEDPISLLGTLHTSGSESSGSTLTAIAVTGSILPEGDGTWDLGSLEHPFRDLYISSASIRIVEGQGVDRIATTFTGDNLKALKAGKSIKSGEEAGTSSVTKELQNPDGDVVVKLGETNTTYPYSIEIRSDRFVGIAAGQNEIVIGKASGSDVIVTGDLYVSESIRHGGASIGPVTTFPNKIYKDLTLPKDSFSVSYAKQVDIEDTAVDSDVTVTLLDGAEWLIIDPEFVFGYM